MHMPGSATTPDQTGARDDAPVCFAFRGVNGVGVRIKCLSRRDSALCRGVAPSFRKISEGVRSAGRPAGSRWWKSTTMKE